MIVEKVRQAVDEKDSRQIHIALSTVALMDRGFYGSDFDDSLNYAIKSNVDGLWQPFDEEATKPVDEWNEDYWDYLLAALMDNFCQERIDLLKKVGRKIYPRVTKETPRTTVYSSPMRASRRHAQKGLSMPVKVGGAIAVAAIGCATIGITKTAIAAVVIVGGAMVLQKKGMK